MQEISKNTFVNGSMNKDLDERLVPNGSYIDALNISIVHSDGSELGVVQNIRGTEEVPFPDYGLIDPKVIGTVANESTNRIYFAVAANNGAGIFEYDQSSNEISTVLIDTTQGEVVDDSGETESQKLAATATVSTLAATGVTETAATLNGALSSIGNSPVTQRGFYYSEGPLTASQLQNSGTKVIASGTTLGGFSKSITPLTRNTEHSYVAYAINNDGEALGQTTTLTTAPISTGVDPQDPTLGIDATGDNTRDTTHVVPATEAVTLRAINVNDPSGGTLSYQWYSGGVQSANQISGATSQNFTTTNNAVGAVDYYVSATSSASSRTGYSQRLRLTHANVSLGTSIRTDEYGTTNIVHPQGESIVIKATVTGSAAATATKMWLKDGSVITSNADQTISADQLELTLKVTALSPSTTGVYSLRVEEGSESAESNNLAVSVNGSPGVFSQSPNTTLSQPHVFSNGQLGYREVTYTYTTAIYQDLQLSDIVDSPAAPATWVDATIQSTSVDGSNTVTVVRYTVNDPAAITASREARKGITFRLKSGQAIGQGVLTTFFKQIVGLAVTGIEYTNYDHLTQTIPAAGGVVNYLPKGDSGAIYNIEVNAIDPAGWIDATALSLSSSAVLRDDPVTDMGAFTIPANTSNQTRTVNLIIVSTSDATNRYAGYVITQDAALDILDADADPDTSGDQGEVPGSFPASPIRNRNNYKQISVMSNKAWIAHLPASSTIKFVQQSLDPAANANADTYLSEVRGNNSNGNNTTTITVYAEENTLTTAIVAEIDFRFYDEYQASGNSAAIQDTIIVNQDAGASAMRLAREISPGQALPATFQVGIGSSNATDFAVITNVSWSIAAGTGFTVSPTTGAGNTALSIYGNAAGLSGNLTLTDTNGVATNVVQAIETSAGITGMAINSSPGSIFENSGASVDVTVQWSNSGRAATVTLYRNTSQSTSGATQVDQVTGITSGNNVFTTNPPDTSVQTYYYYAVITDSVESQNTPYTTVNVAAQPFQIAVNPLTYDFAYSGETKSFVISGLAPGTIFSAQIAGNGYSVTRIPSGGEVPLTGQYGVRVTATATSDLTGTLTLSSDNGGEREVSLTRQSTNPNPTATSGEITFSNPLASLPGVGSGSANTGTLDVNNILPSNGQWNLEGNGITFSQNTGQGNVSGITWTSGSGNDASSGDIVLHAGASTSGAELDRESWAQLSVVGTPAVTTRAASSVGTDRMTFNADATDVGGVAQSIRSTGFEWGTTNDPTSWSDSDTNTQTISAQQITDAGGNFSILAHVLTGLSGGQTIYYRGFVTNTGGNTGYGQVLSETTAAVNAPSVTTLNESNVNLTTVRITGQLTATGGATVTATGFYYRKDGNTATFDINSPTGWTQAAGSSTSGLFTADLTGLDEGSTYQVVAYATNSAGTNTGGFNPFTTLARDPSAVIREGATANVISGQTLQLNSDSTAGTFPIASETWSIASTSFSTIDSSTGLVTGGTGLGNVVVTLTVTDTAGNSDTDTIAVTTITAAATTGSLTNFSPSLTNIDAAGVSGTHGVDVSPSTGQWNIVYGGAIGQGSSGTSRSGSGDRTDVGWSIGATTAVRSGTITLYAGTDQTTQLDQVNFDQVAPVVVADVITSFSLNRPPAVTAVLGEQLIATGSGSGPNTWSNISWTIVSDSTGFAEFTLDNEVLNSRTAFEGTEILGFPNYTGSTGLSGTVVVEASIEKGSESETARQTVTVNIPAGAPL